MSLCIRPVVETWGESLTYLSRDVDIWDLIEAIADISAPQSEAGCLNAAVKDYDDIHVVWIHDGAKFLDYVSTTAPEKILEALSDSVEVSDDDEEAARQLSDVKDLCALAAEWHKSIDPQDGSLRIYCD